MSSFPVLLGEGVSAESSSTFDVDDLTFILLVGSIVLLTAIAAVRWATKSGLPTLLIYLAMGVLLGESALGPNFTDPLLTQVLAYSALVLILTEGGVTTDWSSIRRAVAPAVVLSTVGVLISVFAVATFAYFILGLSWTTSMLLGAILSSTDAAAVFSVLRTVPLPGRISGTLEAESGFNDPPVVILVIALATASAPGSGATNWGFLAIDAVFQLTVGAFFGLGIGFLVGLMLKRSASGSSGLFSIGVVAGCILAYGVATTLNTSGFIATYLAALVLGNIGLPHRSAFRAFSQGLGWIAQILLFVMLGLLANPARLLDQLWPAFVIGLGLLLVARPLSVFGTMVWFKFTQREMWFLSWAGLRGAVPIVLATVPITMGGRHTEWMFDLVFMLVVVFTLVQAPTLPWVSRKLGIIDESHVVDVELDATPLDELNAEVVQVRVGEHSKLHGVEVHELRLPKGANVTLVKRDHGSFVPGPRSVLNHGDQLLIVVPTSQRGAVVKRVRALSDQGRLAGWRKSKA